MISRGLWKWKRSAWTKVMAKVRVESTSTAGTARRVLAHSRSRADGSSRTKLAQWLAPSTAAVNGGWIVQAKEISVRSESSTAGCR